MTSHTSLKAAQQTPFAPFTLAQLKEELKQFIFEFDGDFANMLGPRRGNLGGAGCYSSHESPDAAPVHESYLWQGVVEMYDYGIQGMVATNSVSNSDNDVDGLYADTELFLCGLESLHEYFQEKGIKWPAMSIQTVRTAVARLILEGGHRYSVSGDIPGDQLTIAELALLANMDERSVRNAANPKLEDGLRTVSNGKRTFVERDEAKRWLSTRKGFSPTQVPLDLGKILAISKAAPATTAVTLPAELAAQLEELASQATIPLAELIGQMVAVRAAEKKGGANE